MGITVPDFTYRPLTAQAHFLHLDNAKAVAAPLRCIRANVKTGPTTDTKM